jgi:hypothetical protein
LDAADGTSPLKAADFERSFYSPLATLATPADYDVVKGSAVTRPRSTTPNQLVYRDSARRAGPSRNPLGKYEVVAIPQLRD